uniref:Histone RNA hairpin-binding protein RNA-binding domain-containing protein n=1 Tax=Alexandrium monilatum TaxID=311494 RepID=A0A7S4Q9H9_9DINO
MAAIKPQLLRDRLPRQRLCWADIRDSSNEQLDSQPPPAPVIDSQESYSRLFSMDSMEDGGSRPSLQRQLEQAALLADTPCSSPRAGTTAPRVPGCPGAASAGSSSRPPGSALEARAPTLPMLESPDVLRERWAEATSAPATSGAASSTSPTGTPTGTVRRRVSWKRPPDARTPASGKRRCAATAEGEEPPARGQRPLADASEEDWQRRAEKRQAAVAAIKDSQEYRALQAARSQGKATSAVPGTPDPNDRETSKRSWEAKVMHWRNALKEWLSDDGRMS